MGKSFIRASAARATGSSQRTRRPAGRVAKAGASIVGRSSTRATAPAAPAPAELLSIAPPAPFVPKVRRPGRAPALGLPCGPKPGVTNNKRRPSAVQIGTDMLLVPWSSTRFADLTVVARGIAAELATASPGRGADMLTVLFKIATGEWPRPTYYEKTSHRHLTSVLQLAALAGMSKFFAYDDIDVVGVLDRWLPPLADAPGYPVRVIAGEPVAIKPVAAKVMLALDKAEREGRKIPMAHNHGGSLIGFCEENDLSVHEVRSHEHAEKQVREAAKRPGALGARWNPLFKSPEYTADAKRLLVWMREQHRQKQPLPGCPDRPSIVDLEYMEQQAGVKGRSVGLAAGVREHITMHRADYGVRAREVIKPPVQTCAEFKRVAREWFVAEHGERGADNAMTALNRVYSARDLAPDSGFPSELFSDFAALWGDAAAVKPPLVSPRNLRRPLEILSEYGTRFAVAPDDGLPKPAWEALDYAIRRWGGRMTALERATGIPAEMINLLRTGQRPIPERYVACLPALDETLGTDGGLRRRFEPDAVFRLRDCSALYRSLEPRVRNLLPPGAHKLKDEKLLPLVSQVVENAIKQNRMYSKVLTAAQKFWRDIPDLPNDARVVEEIRLLIRHKTLAVPDDAKRRAKGAWSKSTRNIHRSQLRRFARFCLLSRELGGLGLPVEDVSLALILNWRILATYMEFLARRYEDVEHDGERRGPLLTAHDLMTLQLAASLLHPEYGWVQQRADLFEPRIREIAGTLGPFPGLEELRIRHSGDVDDEVEAEEIEDLLSASAKLFRETMPGEIVESAKRDWFKASLDARDKINNLRVYLLGLIDPSRSPFEPIQDIVDSAKPLSFLRDIAQAAQDDLPDIRTDPIGHATAVRNLLMFVLLSVTALRSKNLRQLTYDPQRGGHIWVENDEVFIKIPWENFKNLGSWRLFGIPGFKFDYERIVKDWFNVKTLFEHYVTKCRPLLVGHFAKRMERNALLRGEPVEGLPRDTKALFPIPSLGLMDEKGLGDIIRDMTRRYHVIDPTTGLVRPGYMFFGPHAVRDILATHIIISSDDPARWEEAADLLQTSIAMVQLRYTKRKVIDRLAKSDRHFDEATEGFRVRAFA